MVRLLELNKIYLGDCFEYFKQIEDESIDIVFTDPPYGLGKSEVVGDESLDTYYRSLPEIYRVLKPDSWFLTFFSIKYLPRAFLSNPFEFVWLISLYHSNRERLTHCPIGKCVQELILVFKKGSPKMEGFLRDVVAYQGLDSSIPVFSDYTFKPVAPVTKVLGAFLKKSGVLLDSFCGTGPILEATKRLGGKFIGIEINPKYYEAALERLSHSPRDLTTVF